MYDKFANSFFIDSRIIHANLLIYYFKQYSYYYIKVCYFSFLAINIVLADWFYQ